MPIIQLFIPNWIIKQNIFHNHLGHPVMSLSFSSTTKDRKFVLNGELNNIVPPSFVSFHYFQQTRGGADRRINNAETGIRQRALSGWRHRSQFASQLEKLCTEKSTPDSNFPILDLEFFRDLSTNLCRLT